MASEYAFVERKWVFWGWGGRGGVNILTEPPPPNIHHIGYYASVGFKIGNIFTLFIDCRLVLVVYGSLRVCSQNFVETSTEFF